MRHSKDSWSLNSAIVEKAIVEDSMDIYRKPSTRIEAVVDYRFQYNEYTKTIHSNIRGADTEKYRILLTPGNNVPVKVNPDNPGIVVLAFEE